MEKYAVLPQLTNVYSGSERQCVVLRIPGGGENDLHLSGRRGRNAALDANFYCARGVRRSVQLQLDAGTLLPLVWAGSRQPFI